MIDRTGIVRDSARRVLWHLRESNLEHLYHLECSVKDVIRGLVDEAGWTQDSYFLAAFFGLEELLVEVTK